jgi:hypothetical protein
MLKYILLILSCLGSLLLFSQTNNMGVGTLNPHQSAKLEVQSTEQGFLAPRMSSLQRLAISSPSEGLLVFDLSDSAYWFYDGIQWKPLDAVIPPFPAPSSDILVSFLSQSGLAGAGPTIIGSGSIAAASLTEDGQWITINAFGEITSDSATVTIKLGNNNLVFPTNIQGNWEINIRAYRETQTSLKATGIMHMDNFSKVARLNVLQDFNAAIPLQIIGSQQPAVVNGLSLEGFSVSRTQ